MLLHESVTPFASNLLPYTTEKLTESLLQFVPP